MDRPTLSSRILARLPAQFVRAAGIAAVGFGLSRIPEFLHAYREYRGLVASAEAGFQFECGMPFVLYDSLARSALLDAVLPSVLVGLALLTCRLRVLTLALALVSIVQLIGDRLCVLPLHFCGPHRQTLAPALFMLLAVITLGIRIARRKRAAAPESAAG